MRVTLIWPECIRGLRGLCVFLQWSQFLLSIWELNWSLQFDALANSLKIRILRNQLASFKDKCHTTLRTRKIGAYMTIFVEYNSIFIVRDSH